MKRLDLALLFGEQMIHFNHEKNIRGWRRFALFTSLRLAVLPSIILAHLSNFTCLFSARQTLVPESDLPTDLKPLLYWNRWSRICLSQVF